MNKKFSPNKVKLLLLFALMLPSYALAVKWIPIINGDITIFIPYEPAPGQAVSKIYEYDALGRLIQVDKDDTVSAEYSYDLAGNRTKVVESGVGADAEEGSIVREGGEVGPPLPDAPANLSYSLTPGSTYDIHWDAVENVAYYELKFVDQPSVQVTDANSYSSPNANIPYWLKACNSSGCSAAVYF